MEHTTLFSSKTARVLAMLVMVCAALALFAQAQSTWTRIDSPYGPTTINVRGEGEVLAKPDIGQFSFSVRAEGEDASTAQNMSAEAINTILEFLKNEGVAENDIKTEYYNLNPKYRYEERVCPMGSFCPPGEQIIDGYEVSQSVSVKVRDLDKGPNLIAGAGERGATNISGLNFTIDDESALQAEARAKAIADAKEKAEKLAADLDMRVVKVVGFYEEQVYGYGGEYAVDNRMMAMDVAEEAMVAPQMPVGENTIRETVNITFEIK